MNDVYFIFISGNWTAKGTKSSTPLFFPNEETK